MIALELIKLWLKKKQIPLMLVILTNKIYTEFTVYFLYTERSPAGNTKHLTVSQPVFHSLSCANSSKIYQGKKGTTVTCK